MAGGQRMKRCEWPRTMNSISDPACPEVLDNSKGRKAMRMTAKRGSFAFLARLAYFSMCLFVLIALQAGNSVDASDSMDASSGEELFNNICSGCHALPNPSQMVPGGWTVTIRRMERYRRSQEMSPLSAAQMRAIRDFLERKE
ncbi:MAG: hypothetical protein CMF59_14385 [Leptospiraceae bacterium]|nr:hypothetical protein [Leptospiraceae bacterium]